MQNLFSFFSQKNDCQLLIVNDDKQAQEAHDILRFHGLMSFTLSDFRANFGDDLLSFNQELQQITQTLQAYYNYKKQNKI